MPELSEACTPLIPFAEPSACDEAPSEGLSPPRKCSLVLMNAERLAASAQPNAMAREWDVINKAVQEGEKLLPELCSRLQTAIRAFATGDARAVEPGLSARALPPAKD
jgi:hypothetical protein